MEDPERLPTCRPALNYYLLAAWPDEYKDDYQSRFVNERVHANIQKDGTYSVVPRMWGGLTIVQGTARHRRRGRQVQHPDGQGHRRPAHRPVRREEGRPSGGLGRSERGRHGLRPCLCQGPAHGEDLRRDRNGAGSARRIRPAWASSWSRCTWGTWTPHKVKLAVSGCPRNCAEATIKDFGVVCGGQRLGALCRRQRRHEGP